MIRLTITLKQITLAQRSANQARAVCTHFYGDITVPVKFIMTQESQQLTLFLPHLDHTAERSEPHHPKTEYGKWFHYTEAHFMIDLKLTPCASLLYHWVLTKGPAGTSIEVDLRDFQALTAEHNSRGRAYSMKQIRRAVGELEKLQLVEITNERVRMIPKHPGEVVNNKPRNKTSIPQAGHQCPTRDINVQRGTLMSQSKVETLAIRSSQSSSDLCRSNRSTTTGPVAVANKVLEKEVQGEQLTAEVNEGKSVEPTNKTQEVKFSAVQLEALKKLGVDLSYRLKTLLAAVEPPQIDQAIACFREDLAGCSGEVKNPAGWFINVLKQVQEDGRQPLQDSQSESQDPVEADLEMWRERWQKCLVISRPAMAKEIATAYPGGEIIVYDEGPVRGK